MSGYYSPEWSFTIQIKLWIENFNVLNVVFLSHFRNQGFFVILCSLNGLQNNSNSRDNELPNSVFYQNSTAPFRQVKSRHNYSLCLYTTIAYAYTQFYRIEGGGGVPLRIQKMF